jgi:DNA-directed RNA polymerase subunit RPC12/RpoP
MENITTISCSNCRRELVRLIIEDNKKISTNLRVKCPYCGNKSFSQYIDGVYVLGSVGSNLCIKNVEVIKSIEEEQILKQEVLVEVIKV